MQRLIAALKTSTPISELLRAARGHPRLAAWITLSTGVGAVLAIAGREAALPLRPWLVLFAVGILVAGLCIKIVMGEAGEGAVSPPIDTDPWVRRELSRPSEPPDLRWS